MSPGNPTADQTLEPERVQRPPLNTHGQIAEAMKRDVARLRRAGKFNPKKPICPCCGSGFPCCADFEVMPQAMSHRMSCQTYRFADLCDTCRHVEEVR